MMALYALTCRGVPQNGMTGETPVAALRGWLRITRGDKFRLATDVEVCDEFRARQEAHPDWGLGLARCTLVVEGLVDMGTLPGAPDPGAVPWPAEQTA